MQCNVLFFLSLYTDKTRDYCKWCYSSQSCMPEESFVGSCAVCEDLYGASQCDIAGCIYDAVECSSACSERSTEYGTLLLPSFLNT